MKYDVDMNALPDYVLTKFQNEGDFDFLKEGMLEKLVDAMIKLDETYMEGLGEDGEYDDDAAYDLMFDNIQKQFPDYKMYAMRLCEDYLDFVEEFLVSQDAIEWI